MYAKCTMLINRKYQQQSHITAWNQKNSVKISHRIIYRACHVWKFHNDALQDTIYGLENNKLYFII